MNTSNSCGCCEGISVDVPALIYNRPGLNNVSYRIGNHPLFKEALKARITSSGQQALKKLTTRNDTDFTIALFDAWAMLADILTFYQERIINESYLRTATERRSVLELAALLGYNLNPGVAASVYIAFCLEETPGSLTLSLDSETADAISEITVDTGIKIQSIPGPDEKAQTFETIESISARPQWNSIAPRLTQKQTLSPFINLIYISGITSGCSIGDTLLIKTGKINTLKRVVDVITDTTNDTTCIKFTDTAQLPGYSRPGGLSAGAISDYNSVTELDDKTLRDIVSKKWDSDDLSALLNIKEWSESDFIRGVNKVCSARENSTDATYIYRKKAFVFGHNAIKEIQYDDNGPKPQSDWTEWDLNESAGEIYLEDGYDEIIAGGYISIQNKGVALNSSSTYIIDSSEVISRTEYGVSGKTTCLSFSDNTNWWPARSDGGDDQLDQIRGTKVYTGSEKLELSELPIEDDISGDTITLNGLILGLKKGQKVIVSGETKDPQGILYSELKELKQVYIENGFTVIQFKKTLTYTYLRSTLQVYANVVLATHGETVEETLGSGDATKKFQEFSLKHTPLTYISSRNPTGAESTLEIRVNDIKWEEVTSFYGCDANDKVYVTRIDNDAVTTVFFGDGITGSRLPGGQDNVKAKYRKGIGKEGNLKKEQLSLLLTKPLGVKSAINPMPSAGGANQENLENAKLNAPQSVLSLNRVVSLSDFEDYSRSFAGIEKAKATWSWKNQKRCIYITVSGPDGAEIKKSDTTYKNLVASLKKSGGLRVPVVVESYRPRYFMLEAKIMVDSSYESDKVLDNVEEKLREDFSFDNRDFGQPVTSSSVVTVIHSVSGVSAVDIDYLYYSDTSATNNSILEAATPEPGNDTTKAAELLTIDPRPINLSILS